MLAKLRVFPQPFWILLACFFFNRIGAALIWPFLAIFIREQTEAALSSITVLYSIQAVASLIGTSIISMVMDKFGRKPPMLFMLIAYSAVLFGMSYATELWQWGVLIACYGMLSPVFLVAANAMTADLFTGEQRTEAYALLRTVANIAIALGPAIGGIFIAESHYRAYYMTIALYLALFIPVLLFVTETLPKNKRKNDAAAQSTGGFAEILRDRAFINYVALYVTLEIGAALVFNLLPVYVNEHFNIGTDGYGRILAINALLVVLFQYAVTRITVRYAPFVALAFGCIFYVFGIGGFGVAQSEQGFMIAMVVMTIGELIIAPTSTALVANMAPEQMRARYMGLYTLAFTMGTGVGPMIGGFLSDAIAPSAIWYFGALMALVAAIGFRTMGNRRKLKNATQ